MLVIQRVVLVLLVSLRFQVFGEVQSQSITNHNDLLLNNQKTSNSVYNKFIPINDGVEEKVKQILDHTVTSSYQVQAPISNNEWYPKPIVPNVPTNQGSYITWNQQNSYATETPLTDTTNQYSSKLTHLSPIYFVNATIAPEVNSSEMKFSFRASVMNFLDRMRTFIANMFKYFFVAEEDNPNGMARKKKYKIKKKYKKFMLPLLLAYKLKFFTLIPLLIAMKVLLAGSTGMAGFFFALFAAVMTLKHNAHH